MYRQEPYNLGGCWRKLSLEKGTQRKQTQGTRKMCKSYVKMLEVNSKYDLNARQRIFEEPKMHMNINF
eukprot:1192432-Amphidinium_carterae.1